MARRNKPSKKKTVSASVVNDAKVPQIAYRQLLEGNMKEYGTYVIEQRAIPDGIDGLKPVHRRILWSAYSEGYRNSGSTVKTSKLVGNCFGAGTPVSTPNGPTAIESLEVGDSVNTSQGVKKVTQTFENPEASVYLLELHSGNSVVLTEDQCVKVKIGDAFYWKPASELSDSDQIVVEI